MAFGDWGGAAIGLAGDLIGAGISSAQAGAQRRFQERMYKHRYQYQMEDMQKAGLNPILAAGSQPPGPPAGAMGKINPRLGSDMRLTDAQARLANSAAALNEAKEPKERISSRIFTKAGEMGTAAEKIWNNLQKDSPLFRGDYGGKLGEIYGGGAKGLQNYLHNRIMESFKSELQGR